MDSDDHNNLVMSLTKKAIHNDCPFKGEAIEHPGEHDLILGRGGESNNHTGNIKFRSIIENIKTVYRTAPRSQKQFIVRKIVADWRALNPPGRFLSKTTTATCTVYYDVGDEAARKRTAKSLSERIKKPSLLSSNETETYTGPTAFMFVGSYDQRTSQSPQDWPSESDLSSRQDDIMRQLAGVTGTGTCTSKERTASAKSIPRNKPIVSTSIPTSPNQVSVRKETNRPSHSRLLQQIEQEDDDILAFYHLQQQKKISHHKWANPNVKGKRDNQYAPGFLIHQGVAQEISDDEDELPTAAALIRANFFP